MSIDFSVGILTLILGGMFALVIVFNVVLKLCDLLRPTWAAAIRDYSFAGGLSMLVLLLILLVIAPIILIGVSPGQVGVLWKRFSGGTVLGEPFSEGTVLVLPWDRLYIYSARFQTVELPVEAVSSEGLKVSLNLVVRYRPVYNNIPLLHKLVGVNYSQVLLMPEVGSSARLVVSHYTAEQIYANKRQQIQSEIFNGTNLALKLNQRKLFVEENIKDLSEFVQLEDILIRDVVLPEQVDKAIVNKVNQKYLDEEYLIRLEVAKKEAKRKETEAKGIAAFQATVTGGISETYLRWRGIEATVELAKSHNAKVVVIGGGKDGLPLILNTESSLSGPNLNVNSKAVEQVTKPPIVEGPQEHRLEISSGEYNPSRVATNDPATTSAYDPATSAAFNPPKPIQQR